jgi:hypothetical protein
MMGQTGAEHAYFAGSGDVDEVGAEAVEDFSNEGNVARKCRVEAEVFFESEGEDAARKFEGPDVAIFDECLATVTGANTEERQIATASECLELAAGVRDPVDFMKGVGKVRYSREVWRHAGLELFPTNLAYIRR